jgi:hypothetical protein
MFWLYRIGIGLKAGEHQPKNRKEKDQCNDPSQSRPKESA